MALNYDSLPAILGLHLGKSVEVVKNLIETIEITNKPEDAKEMTKSARNYLMNVDRVVEEIYKEEKK